MAGIAEVTMTFDVAGQANEIVPRLVRLYAQNNTLAEIAVEGFLNRYLKSQGYNLMSTDFVAVVASDGDGWYQPTFTLGVPTSVTLIPFPIAAASGNIPWTPTITFAVPGDLSVVYNLQIANYAASGNIGLIGFVVDFVPTYTTSSGNLEILGFPVGPQIVGTFGAGLLQVPAFPASTTSIAMNIQGSPGKILVESSGSGVAIAAFGTTQFLSGVTYNIQGTIPFFI